MSLPPPPLIDNDPVNLSPSFKLNISISWVNGLTWTIFTWEALTIENVTVKNKTAAIKPSFTFNSFPVYFGLLCKYKTS